MVPSSDDKTFDEILQELGGAPEEPSDEDAGYDDQDQQTHSNNHHHNYRGTGAEFDEPGQAQTHNWQDLLQGECSMPSDHDKLLALDRRPPASSSRVETKRVQGTSFDLSTDYGQAHYDPHYHARASPSTFQPHQHHQPNPNALRIPRYDSISPSQSSGPSIIRPIPRHPTPLSQTAVLPQAQTTWSQSHPSPLAQDHSRNRIESTVSGTALNMGDPSRFRYQSGPGGDGRMDSEAGRNLKTGNRNHQSSSRAAHEVEDEYFGGDDDGAFERDLMACESGTSNNQNFVRQPAAPKAPQLQPRQARQPELPRRRQDVVAPRVEKPARGGVKLRPVSELPDVCRSLFKFGVFNGVQSVCFERVSAPTGAGKTVIFELAILRLLSSGSGDSKVVYVAPTKSLCSERAADWKLKFATWGWEVIELTGDVGNGSLKDATAARVIITTPEKWDAMTRNWHSYERLLNKISLLCLDEVHTVGVPVRGAVLEVIVSRMRTLGTRMRIIGVSATVPNVRDVAEWLGSNPEQENEDSDGRLTVPATVFAFGDEFRPVPLKKIVVGVSKGSTNDWAFASVLNSKLMDLIRQHAGGKPVLIFCSTRKSTVKAAQVLATSYRELVDKRGVLPWRKPARPLFQFADKQLAALVEVGIAFHHAGLEAQDRRAVEQGFIEGTLFAVCATSTLATGVNLPARMVIVNGTAQWAEGKFQEYSDMDLLQMMGRAGRPQFDTSGVACILTDKGLEKRYTDLANSERILESCLHTSLTENVNAEINLGTITTPATALKWLHSTFLSVRIRQNPSHYAIDSAGSESPEQRLEEITLAAVAELVASGVVEEAGDSLTSTRFGHLMTRYYVSHASFLLLKALPIKANMRTLLETLSTCAEFQNLRFRQGEKGSYAKINKLLKFPAKQLSGPPDKFMVLVQMVLEGISLAEVKTVDSNPSMEVLVLWQNISRLVKCMVEIASEREDAGVKTALELLRSVSAKAWDGTPTILRQLDGVGEKTIKIFADKGICSFKDVYECEPGRLETLVNRNPPFGRKLIAQARTFPQFRIEVSTEGEEEKLEDGVKINLRVSVGLRVTEPRPITGRGRARFWASVVLVTSDNEFIEFRRIRVEQLFTPKDFTVAVVLVKKSQRIIATISCEDIAGSEAKFILKPIIDASNFPLPILGQVAIHDIQEENDVDNPIPPAAVERKPALKSKGKAKEIVSIDSDDSSPVRLPDGRYACNHLCKDKTSCRHLCCREGLDKPPKRAKKSNDATAKPTKLKKSKALPLFSKGSSDSEQEKPAPKTKPPSRKESASRPIAPRKLAPLKSSGIVGTASKQSVSEWLDDSDDEEGLASLDSLFTPHLPLQSNPTSQLPPTKASSSKLVAKPKMLIISEDEDSEEDEIDQLDSPSPSPRQISHRNDSRPPKRAGSTMDKSPVKRGKEEDPLSAFEEALFEPPPSASSRTTVERPRDRDGVVEKPELKDVEMKDGPVVGGGQNEEDFDAWLEENVEVVD